MTHISEIKMAPVLSASGNVKISDTVRRAIANIKSLGRNTASVQDITFVINNNLNASRHVTEAQVSNVMRAMAVEGKRGEVYKVIGKPVVSIDGYFYSF